MRVLSLQSAGVQSGVAVFAVGLEADNGTRHALWMSGKTMENPVEFAAKASADLNTPCSSEFVGDAGGWQAHLGDLLRNSSVTAPTVSNVTFSAAAPADADRRAKLLSATSLGQATLAAERAAALAASKPAATPEVVAETFSEQCRRANEETDRARRAEMSNLFKLTHLGRDVLAADKKAGK